MVVIGELWCEIEISQLDSVRMIEVYIYEKGLNLLLTGQYRQANGRLLSKVPFRKLGHRDKRLNILL